MDLKHTITEIRAAYPHPVRSIDARTERKDVADQPYSVGGALCLKLAQIEPAYRWALNRFPDVDVLTLTLQHFDKYLREEIAEILAEAILTYNEQGNFEKAWGIAEKVLIAYDTDT